MASLTIRKLDDAIKAYLRLRSAKNGRSVEEEVRVILREYLEGRPVPAASPVPSPAEAPAHALRAGPDPAAEGAAHPCPLRADPGGAAVRHAAGGQCPLP